MSAFTPDQEKWLRWLHERGGKGYIDRYGRVVARGELAPQGALVAWLKLVAHGLVYGEQEYLRITDAGYASIGIKDARKEAA